MTDRTRSEIALTERLRLRTWTLDEADIQAGVRIWSDPEVMRWVSNGQPLTRQQIEGHLAAGLTHQEQHGVQHWAVELKETGEVIGACGFNVDEGGPALEIVYHFAQAWWGQRYASEAARAAFDHALGTMQPPKIVAAHRLENAASGRILAGLGFTDEGVQFFEDSGADERVWVWTPPSA